MTTPPPNTPPPTTPPGSPEGGPPRPGGPYHPYTPQQGWYPPPSAWPAPGYPQWPQYPYPSQLPPPPPRSSGEIIGAVIVGVTVYVVINLLVGPMVLLGLANVISPKAAFVIGAIMLGSIAFGGGAALIARSRRRPWPKGIGMGLMIGWALTSVLTAGLCTGLNPVMYTWSR
ncbi:hypothetical protein ACQI5H_24355 [Mycobacterium heidelbergense]|uniref:hypothetical protein n=1 Tax=Mycobacterium heidelbergense TaxID=53376 RepID=UPI003CF4B2E6